MQAQGLAVGGMVLSPEFIIAVIGFAVGYGVLKARVDSAVRGVGDLSTELKRIGAKVDDVATRQARMEGELSGARRRARDEDE